MKTELNFLGRRIKMASRIRRRQLVVLIYVGFTALVLAWFSEPAQTFAAWCIVLAYSLLLAITSLVGNGYDSGDEREIYRRDHAHFMAYRSLGYVLVLALFAAYFRGPNPVTPALAPALRSFLYQLPYELLMAAGVIYLTLPRAILLWTEPDMEEAQ